MGNSRSHDGLPAATKPGVNLEVAHIDKAITLRDLSFTKEFKHALRAILESPDPLKHASGKLSQTAQERQFKGKEIVEHALMIIQNILIVAERSTVMDRNSATMTYEDRRRADFTSIATSLSNKMRITAAQYLQHPNEGQRNISRTLVVRQLVTQFVNLLANKKIKCQWILSDQSDYIESVQSTYDEIVRQAGVACHFPILRHATPENDSKGIDYLLGDKAVQMKAKHNCNTVVCYRADELEKVFQRFFRSDKVQSARGKIEQFFRSYPDGVLLVTPARLFDPVTLDIDPTQCDITKDNIEVMLQNLAKQ